MATPQTNPGKKPAPGIRPFRPHVIAAVFKRNLQSYFSNPAGYVFITLFVLISSALAFWQDEFFTNNLANLDQLNRYMPYLLLFFIPAVTMSLWADERRQGTDELLLTLPAHDLDVVLGKYLAALGIYTVALLFSTSHLLVLSYLGRPDLGVMFSTYLGYWLMGGLLIAVGMVASLLSANVTVAFILGALFCAIPLFIGILGSPTGINLRRQLEGWSAPARFAPFGEGVIPLSGLFYFVGLAAAMLYLNMLLLGRRHWAGGESSRGRWAHAAIRFTSVVVALFGANVLLDLWGQRADASSEGLNTLTAESIALIDKIPAEKPVLIEAYYSPEVPREYVKAKADLLRNLREYQARSGGRIQLNLIPTELFSTAARDAEKRFGIQPRRVFSTDQAKQSSTEIFLGVAFTSGLEEVVIPFFDRGLPVEYELTRSMQVVSRSGRKKVGILTTDAKLMGGFDQRSFGQTPEWSIVTELKKQYEVSSVSPDAPISSDLDVLLVAQPSSLSQPQIDNLTGFVRGGGGTLLLMDPFPADNPQIAPEVPKQPPGGPFGGGAPPDQKGDLRELLELINVEWPTTEIVWNNYNPHRQLADMAPEVVFIGHDPDAPDALNPNEAATSGLQEVVTLFPGLLRPRAGGAGPEFTPLLRTSDMGGVIEWSEAVQQGFMGVSGINPRRRHFKSGQAYTLAARVKGQAAAEKKAEPAAEKKDEAKADEKPATINVIAIADLDMVSEQFFEIRRRKIENLDLDNVTFVLNCVDVLAGDESFVALRKKRPQHRTLTTIEAQTNRFLDDLQGEIKLAEDAAKAKLDDAQKALDKQVEQVRSRTELDERTKEIMLANLQEVAQRRLDVEKQKIEDEKLSRIREGRAESERKTRAIEDRVRWLAAGIPPLPPLILGLMVLLGRLRRENLGASPKRMAP